MSRIKRFCTECGKEDIKLTSSMLCEKCFLKKFPLFELKEHRFPVKVCPSCFSYSLKRGFISTRSRNFEQVFREIIERVVKKAISVQFYADISEISYDPPSEPVRRVIPVSVVLKHKEEDVRDSAIIEVELIPEKCPMCRRRERGVSEAIIQLRKEKGRVSDEEVNAVLSIIENLAASSGNPKAYVADVRKSGKGYDIFIGDLKFAERAANAVKRKIGCKIKISRTVSGVDDSGRPIMTASILLILSSRQR
ncbi:MAG: NMD3-related protein [Candidatus Baldrarchaeia archaeon]